MSFIIITNSKKDDVFVSNKQKQSPFISHKIGQTNRQKWAKDINRYFQEKSKQLINIVKI